MNPENIIGDLGKITVFLLVLLALYLFSAPTKRKLPNYLFASFLLVTAFDMMGWFIEPPQSIILRGLKISSVLLQMPLFYLYVKSACYYNFKLSTKHLLHGILFLAVFILFILTDLSDQSLTVFEILSKIQYYYYIIAIFYSLTIFKRVYQNNYSSNHKITYQWLLRTTILFLIGNTFVTIRELMNSNHPVLIYLNLFISLFALFVICWFVLNGLRKPNLFVGVDHNLTPVHSHKPETEKPEDLKKLIEYIETEKPYLDDKLTLQKLAEPLDVPEKQLSALINKKTGMHFFDFINSYRIKDAQTLLKEQPDLTVLEVLYDVGFNSKSSFYTAFKKATGITPTAYRKSTL